MSDNSTSDRTFVVVTASDGSSFAQQGTLDWTSLSKSTVNMTVGVLGRLATAGVEPHTMLVAQKIAGIFRLSTLGQHRLHHTLNKLPCAAAMGDALWFGFGIKHIVRTLAQTREGTQWMMLASALTAVHTIEQAVYIVDAFAETVLGGKCLEMAPSIRQWCALIDASSGVLATTNFPLMAEHMMGLNRGLDEIGVEHSVLRQDQHDVAKALFMIARLSTNELHSATVAGDPACGWLAAFSRWFFDLRVEIRDQAGNTLHAGQSNKQSTALRLHITTGGIESRSGRQWDRTLEMNTRTAQDYPVQSMTKVTSIPSSPRTCSDGFDVQLIEEEQREGLVLAFGIATPNSVFMYSIKRLMRALEHASADVFCKRSGCDPIVSPLELVVARGEGKFDWTEIERRFAGKPLVLLLRQVGGGPITRCIVLMEGFDEGFRQLLQQDECMPCMIKGALNVIAERVPKKSDDVCIIQKS